MKKRISLILLLALVFALIPTASFAASGAVLSSQNLTVNGKLVNCEKYNIGGSNYFKLRDLAYMLNGTANQFDVGWDPDQSLITVTTGQPYTSPNGTEMKTGQDNSSKAQVSAQTLMINGVIRTDLSVYNIGGSNFFKLRELGQALGFAVSYNGATNTAIVVSCGDSAFDVLKAKAVNEGEVQSNDSFIFNFFNDYTENILYYHALGYDLEKDTISLSLGESDGNTSLVTTLRIPSNLTGPYATYWSDDLTGEEKLGYGTVYPAAIQRPDLYDPGLSLDLYEGPEELLGDINNIYKNAVTLVLANAYLKILQEYDHYVSELGFTNIGF